MSFTHYHAESWSSAWNIEKMLLATISFMNTNEDTTGSIRCGDYQRRRFAKMSILFNLRNQDFVSIFGSDFKELGIDNKLL